MRDKWSKIDLKSCRSGRRLTHRTCAARMFAGEKILESGLITIRSRLQIHPEPVVSVNSYTPSSSVTNLDIRANGS